MSRNRHDRDSTARPRTRLVARSRRVVKFISPLILLATLTALLTAFIDQIILSGHARALVAIILEVVESYLGLPFGLGLGFGIGLGAWIVRLSLRRW